MPDGSPAAIKRQRPDSNIRIGALWQSFLFQKPLEGGRRLKCRNVVRRNFDRRILRDVTRRLFFAMLNQERTKTAEENVFLADLCGSHLFHETFHDG